ncbi:MAG: serine protease [Deltaproteobacteria bacterium]|nr:serine protease [Deltaproteobacteria bacterium]
MNASVRLLERTLPATVHLRATVPDAHPSASVLGTERSGSGAVIDEGGLIVTVNYVVLGADAVRVTTSDGREVPAEVVAQDFATGLALVQAAGAAFRALPVADEPGSLAVGDDAFIVASIGDAGRRASAGGITAVEPFDANWEYALERAIFASAMNPGLGGGPLIDRRGRVAGVVSLNMSEIGRFSLAIPIEHYVAHRDELLRHGRRTTRPSRAWLGLFCYLLRGQVVVAGLLDGGPADAAGLAQGDVVLAVGDHAVRSRREFYERLWDHRAGDEVRLRVFRDDAPRSVVVPSVDVEEFFA